MRAKNEFKFIAEAYNTKLLLERVVDGTLMCPEACCGAPVMECKCGPDCPHCNCHEIQKLSKKEEDAEDIFPNSEYGRSLRRAAKQHEQEDKEAKALEWELGGGRYTHPAKTYNSGSPRVRLTRDSPGTASVHLPEGDPNIQKYIDKGYKIVKDYKKAEQSFATPELKRKEARDQMWAKRKARWAAWKKGQVRSEDNEDLYTTLDATVRDFEQELDIQGDGIDTNVNELKDYIDIIKGLKVSEIQKKSALKYLSELKGPGGRAGLEDVDYNFVFGVDV